MSDRTVARNPGEGSQVLIRVRIRVVIVVTVDFIYDLVRTTAWRQDDTLIELVQVLDLSDLKAKVVDVIVLVIGIKFLEKLVQGGHS